MALRESSDDFFDQNEEEDSSGPEFRVLDLSKLEREQNELTKRISSLTSLPEALSELILISYKWKEEKLMQDYFDNEDKVCLEQFVVFTWPFRF